MAGFNKYTGSDILENGIYQKIVWLGVNGYLIINKPDREILMVDPFPSYGKPGASHHKRLKNLVKWLREQVDKGFSLTGILVGHEHYDHCKDVVPIIKLLSEERDDIGPVCPLEKLPVAYCDTGTMLALAEERGDAELTVQDFKLADGTPIYYGDTKQERLSQNPQFRSHYPLTAGTPLNSLKIGAFKVTPYIWDHASTIPSDSLSGGTALAGAYQRQTAFLIQSADGKRLFLNGSAGEMSVRSTGNNVNNLKIETDILIQAITQKGILPPATYTRRVKEVVAYQARNFTVKDKIIATHFEAFIFAVDGKGELEKHSDFVEKYVSELRKISPAQADTVHIMKRFGFEFDAIPV